MDLSGSTYPEAVTRGNWTEIQEQGFSWLTNMNWPLADHPKEGLQETPREYLEGLVSELGADNVLLGYPFSQRLGLVHYSRLQAGSAIGVYVRSVKS